MRQHMNDFNVYLTEHPLNWDDTEPALEKIFRAYCDSCAKEDVKIKQDFQEIYAAMDGQPLCQIDSVINAACALSVDYQRAGFLDGLKFGFQLKKELTETTGT